MGKKDKEPSATSSDLNNLIERDIPEEVKQRVTKQIARAFHVFDALGNDTCDVREVGTILRSLNVYPSEELLKTWIKEMEEEEPTGYIHKDKFTKIALRLLTTNPHPRDDEEILYRAFLTLDTEQKGYLTPDELKEYMQSEGSEPFTHEEMEEFLAAAVDPTDNRIYYEDYVTMLSRSAEV